MSYRPEGWENPHKETQEELGDLIADKTMQAVKIACYEAGADAYEEGLKREALQEYGISKPRADMPAMLTIAVPDKRGYLVFIPEEER